MSSGESCFRSSCIVPIAVALITVLGTVAVALINSGILWPPGSDHPTAQTQLAGTPVASSAPAGFRVVETSVQADPLNYAGPCPVTITFRGRISVAGGSGRVSYKWLRSDGASAPVETVTFDRPGSQDISTTWMLGGSDLPIYTGWQSIEILDPEERTSAQANFNIQCR